MHAYWIADAAYSSGKQANLRQTLAQEKKALRLKQPLAVFEKTHACNFARSQQEQQIAWLRLRPWGESRQLPLPNTSTQPTTSSI